MRICCSLFFFSLSIHVLLGQELATGEKALREVIKELEAAYDTKVSYADEIIKDKKVSLEIDTRIPLGELLGHLERQTQVRFEAVGAHFIMIRPFYAEDMVPLCGEVVGEEGKALSHLVVQTDSGAVAITDKDGYFEISAPYGSYLTFRHISYVTKKRPARAFLSQPCQKVAMVPALSMLDQLEVSNYLTGGITKEGKDVQIFPQKLEILPGLIEPDILQTIQQTPGVNSPYETASGIHVRGGSPDQNLVLWNGIKTYNQGHFFGMLSSFNPYITKKVSFIKSGTSAAYGGRVSSVIDIKTDEEVSEAFGGGAGLNMISGDGYVKVPLIKNKLSAMISGRRSYADLLPTYTYNQMSYRVFQNTKITDELQQNPIQADNQFYFGDFNSSLIWQPSTSQTVVVNALYSKNDLDFSSEDENTGEAYQDLLHTENEGYNIKWQHEQERFSIAADAYFARYLLHYQFLTSENDTVSSSSKKNLIDDLGGGLNAYYKFSEKHKLAGGYQFTHNSIRYAFEDETPDYHLVLDADDRTVATHSVYSEYQFASEKTAVSAGLRVNQYTELDQLYWEPRVSLQQRLVTPLYLNITGEYRSQVVSQIKESVVSDLSLENQVWRLASTERFPVIDSYQLTSGLTWDKNDWYLDAEAYYKQIDGVTTLTFGFLNPTGSDYITGSSAIRGLDFFIKKEVGDYSSWASYSYLHTENQFSGLNDDRPFPGNWNIKHHVQWSHLYKWRNLQFSLGWMWHTGKAYTLVTSTQGESGGPVTISYDGINEHTLPVYHRLDFSMLYDFYIGSSQKVKYRVGLSVLNAYNRKNLLNREFRTTPALDNELIDTRVYSLGVTPNLVFRCFW